MCDCAGTWQQYVVVHVDNLFPVRPEVSNEDASQYFVNPCTGDALQKQSNSQYVTRMRWFVRPLFALRVADALL